VTYALPTGVAGPGSAPELDFELRSAAVLDHAAVPTLRFELGVSADPPNVRSASLNVEIRIAATRRRYEQAERSRLTEVFGREDEWSRNLHALHWTGMTVNLPAFTGSTVVELPVTCTYDLEVAAARYLNALERGKVPLEFLFSGTVFYSGDDGRLQVGRIGWDKECRYLLPVSVWREAMDRHFAGTAWLRLGRESFDRLTAYKARHTLLDWDATVDRLLDGADE
jgi:hypothetical protein